MCLCVWVLAGRRLFALQALAQRLAFRAQPHMITGTSQQESHKAQFLDRDSGMEGVKKERW